MRKIHLRSLRKSLKLTQKEFADILDKPRASYAFLEAKSPVDLDESLFSELTANLDVNLINSHIIEIDTELEEIRNAAQITYQNFYKAIEACPEFKTVFELHVERKAKEITKTELKELIKELMERQ